MSLFQTNIRPEYVAQMQAKDIQEQWAESQAA